MSNKKNQKITEIRPYKTSLFHILAGQLNKRRFGPEDFRHYRSAWKGVYGWLRDIEAVALFEFAKSNALRGSIVEIGSAYGRSTVCLGWGARLAGAGKVYAVDPHIGGIGYRKKLGEAKESFNSYEGLLENINRFGLDDVIIPWKMTSEEAVKNWDGTKIRLLFVDGWHTYEAVKHDILAWSEFVTPQGVFILHDFHVADIRRAIFDSMETLKVPQSSLVQVSKSMVYFLRM